MYNRYNRNSNGKMVAYFGVPNGFKTRGLPKCDDSRLCQLTFGLIEIPARADLNEAILAVMKVRQVKLDAIG